MYKIALVVHHIETYKLHTARVVRAQKNTRYPYNFETYAGALLHSTCVCALCLFECMYAIAIVVRSIWC